VETGTEAGEVGSPDEETGSPGGERADSRSPASEVGESDGCSGVVDRDGRGGEEDPAQSPEEDREARHRGQGPNPRERTPGPWNPIESSGTDAAYRP
jgi:hypothetical protein